MREPLDGLRVQTGLRVFTTRHHTPARPRAHLRPRTNRDVAHTVVNCRLRVAKGALSEGARHGRGARTHMHSNCRRRRVPARSRCAGSYAAAATATAAATTATTATATTATATTAAAATTACRLNACRKRGHLIRWSRDEFSNAFWERGSETDVRCTLN